MHVQVKRLFFRCQEYILDGAISKKSHVASTMLHWHLDGISVTCLPTCQVPMSIRRVFYGSIPYRAFTIEPGLSTKLLPILKRPFLGSTTPISKADLNEKDTVILYAFRSPIVTIADIDFPKALSEELDQGKHQFVPVLVSERRNNTHTNLQFVNTVAQKHDLPVDCTPSGSTMRVAHVRCSPKTEIPMVLVNTPPFPSDETGCELF